MNRQKMIFVLMAGLVLAGDLSAQTSYMGPLGGRNMYAPHLPWFSFPAQSAGADTPGELRIRNALYFLNEFGSYPFDTDDLPFSPAEQESFTAVDYESSIWETGIDWQVNSEWRLSADWRLHFRYGGYFDSIIEWWHAGFGLPNAGREYFPQDRSYWDIQTDEGQSYSGNGTTVASGDMDIRTVWSFYSGHTLNMAASAAFKLPVGTREGGFSSGFPDFGIAFLVDWQPQFDRWEKRASDSSASDSRPLTRRWIFFTNAALIIPTGPAGRMMWQVIPAVEFRLDSNLSLLVQMNLQRSPIAGNQKYLHPIFGRTTMFSLPQTDIKVGLKGETGKLMWQFYIEEDPLSWEGPDLLALLEISLQIR